VVLVVGQAAQGKTTLVADYLSLSASPLVWLNLSSGSAGTPRFDDVLVHGIQQALNEQPFSDPANKPCLLMETGQQAAGSPERLHALMASLPAPLRLVLDGLDAVWPDSSALPLIEEMIARLPAGVRLFLVSRSMPPLRLERLQVQQKVLILTNGELAFNADEIRGFFVSTRNLELGDDAVGQLARLTGGWAGALVLIGQWLARQPIDDRLEDALADGLPPDVQRDVFRYFADEVFACQKTATQRFLLRCALLDVMEPDIVAELTGQVDSLKQLQELVRRNLFIHATRDRAKAWRFQFNPLFHAFLRNRLEVTTSPAACRRLLVKAGKHYAMDHRNETAIPLFFQARAFELAAAAIKKAGPDWSIKGRTADLADWITRLPPQMVRDDPWLLYLLTVTRRLSGGRRSLADFEAALLNFTLGGDKRGQMLAMAGRIEAAVFAGQQGRDLEPWLQKAQGLIRQTGETAFYTYAKAALWMQIGFGHIAGTGDLQRGLSACQNAYLLANKSGNKILQAHGSIVYAFGQTLAGDFTEAARSLERLDAPAGQDVYPEYRTLKALVHLELALAKGDEAAARRGRDTIQKDIEAFGLLFVYPVFIDAAARLALLAGQFEAAAAAQRHLADVAVLGDTGAYAGLSVRLDALIQYHSGRHGPAVAAASKACRILGRAGRSGLVFYQARLIQGLAGRHLRLIEDSERIFSEALAHFEQVGQHLAACQAHMGLALLRADTGAAAPMRHHLAAAMQIAEEKRYGYFPVISPKDLTAVCMLCLQNDVAAKTAARFLFSAPVQKGGICVDEVVWPLQGQKPAASPSLRRVLRRVNLPVLSIRTFGGFAIQRADTAISDDQWSGSRPRLLLKSLLVHGGKDVPKDIVIDDLWPDSKPAAALQSFKVTLHRLRRILEPDMDSRYGSGYVHLKDNLVSLDSDLVRCDVDAFEDLCQRITGCGPAVDHECLQDLVRRLNEMVRGDFLAEEPYAAWIGPRRKALREQFIGVMQQSAEIFQRLSRWGAAAFCFQAIIRCDAAVEAAHRGLMQSYARQGMRSQALKVYEDYKLTIAGDLGAAPDAATTDLYNEIRLGACPSSL
jgi:ATP/maltotriose-dependent transcriptional regulator MalT/DNA-binding SARP family transcriptional activator